MLATEALSGIQLLGDDLFCTNKQRVAKGIQLGAANAVLVKPNQIGTLTDAREVVDFAHSAGMATILSARSGETEDSWLSDLAVGWGTGQIKVGSTMSPSGRASGTVFWRSRRGFVMVRITPVAMLLRPTPTRLHVLDGSTLQTFCEAMGRRFNLTTIEVISVTISQMEHGDRTDSA